MRSLVIVFASAVLIAPAASAETAAFTPSLFASPTPRGMWQASWPSCGDIADSGSTPTAGVFPALTLRYDDAAGAAATAQPLHAAAIEHSDAYLMRAKIHKYASFATIPLFITEFALGQSLYNTPANANKYRGAHAAVGAGIVGLFAVNTVTGAWNMFGEGRRDKEGRTLRLVHGLLMMAADVGFLATTRSGPNSNSRRETLTFETDKVTHRNMAIASMSIGTAGYLLMLFGNH